MWGEAGGGRPEQIGTREIQERRHRRQGGRLTPGEEELGESGVSGFLGSFRLFYNKYDSICKRKYASYAIMGESIMLTVPNPSSVARSVSGLPCSCSQT